MNGEIDVIPQSALRKVKSGSGSLSSGHTGSSIHLQTANSNIYSSLLDCHDFRNSSSGILSVGSDPSFDDNCDDTPEDTMDSHLSSGLFSSRAASSDSSLISPTLTAAVDSSNLDTYTMTDSGLPPCASVFDSLMGNQSLPIPKPPVCFPSEVSEEKLVCDPSRLDDSKSGVISSDITCCGDPGFLQTPTIGNACEDSVPKFLFSVNNLEDFQLASLQHESQHQRLDQGAYPFQNGSYKSNHRTLQAGDTTFSVSDRDPYIPPVTPWIKSADSSQLPGDMSSFPFPNDNLPQLLANPLTDHPVSTFDSALSSIPCSSVASAAARRAITGGHNSTRFSPASRPTTWNNNTSGPGSSLGSVSANWNTSGNYASKTGSNFLGSSNLVSNPPNSSTLWNQMLNNQLNQSKSSSITNMLGNLSLGNGNVTENSNSRSHLNCTSTSLNSTFHTTNVNKNAFSAGLANVYSMFPKRPQHRMMAHWQQQQHHHNPITHQSQPSKNQGTLQTETLQLLNGNRLPNEGMEAISGTGAAGDVSNILNFNSGCSVLHALPTIASSSTINSLSAGSSDSFSSIVTPASSSSNDNAFLDTFKFGLDQHLMEVIKSLESNRLNNASSMGSNTNNNNDGANVGALDEVGIPPFSDVDQQFPGLASVNQLPVIGTNAVTSGVPGLGGMGCATFRNVSGPSLFGSVGMPHVYSMFPNISSREEGYSRKVFVGGLPPDIDEEEITTAFRRFGPLIVDWPHKTESKAYFPPKGYCFLLFQDERSVQSLIGACIVDEGKYYWCVSSPTMKDKPVQIRPWNLADSDFVMDGSQPLDPRKTIFVGGVPRPLRAIELALIMDRLYSGVCYAGIDTDPELKYPKGAGRVAFSNQQSYIAAISARFVQLQHNEIDKRVEVKPYVLDNQMCDECQGARCGGKFAPFFCANVTCLQYYCEQCWVQIHSRNGREYHKPLVKEGAERPRPALYRW